jgi:SAM-dependent methyltransferase
MRHEERPTTTNEEGAMGTPAFATQVNRVEFEQKVKEMYQRVAQEPTGEFHFEMGRGLAERLGYAPADLDRIPRETIDSFAGVGYHFDLAGLKAGEHVLDLGSGSGMDTFVAALKVGSGGRVVGVDMTDAQRAKAERLRDAAGFTQTTYVKGYIETLPVQDGSFDAVISNGVINLSADKPRVFREVARVLRRGGRLAIFGHHLGEVAARERDVQRDALGGLHRGRHATGRLLQRDPGGRPAHRPHPGESPVSLPDRVRPESLRDLRGAQRVAARRAGLNRRENPPPGTGAAPAPPRRRPLRFSDASPAPHRGSP